MSIQIIRHTDSWEHFGLFNTTLFDAFKCIYLHSTLKIRSRFLTVLFLLLVLSFENKNFEGLNSKHIQGRDILSSFKYGCRKSELF